MLRIACWAVGSLCVAALPTCPPGLRSSQWHLQVRCRAHTCRPVQQHPRAHGLMCVPFVLGIVVCRLGSVLCGRRRRWVRLFCGGARMRSLCRRVRAGCVCGGPVLGASVRASVVRARVGARHGLRRCTRIRALVVLQYREFLSRPLDAKGSGTHLGLSFF